MYTCIYLTSAVLAKHHDDFRISEATSIHVQFELALQLSAAAHGLGHLRVGVSAGTIVCSISDLVAARQLEVELLLAETQILGGNEACEEDVDAFSHAEWHGDDTVDRGDSIQAADVIYNILLMVSIQICMLVFFPSNKNNNK